MSAVQYTRNQVYAATLEYFQGDTLQTNVFVDKYALRDREGSYYELTPDDMHRRIAREFARIEAKYPNPLTEEEIYQYLKLFRYIVPQGSPMFGIGNPYQIVSLSNCAVLAQPEDTMSSILETGRDMANLYKRRFGVGSGLDNLRPEGAPVSNAAITSTGAWSFADLFSYITRMVGQSGRRGALMLTLDVRHPDIDKFITMKKDLTKVTGANVSVKVTDAFMEAVEKDENFVLRWPVTAAVEEAKVTRTVRARELFDLIATTACETGEPGFLFWDQITNNLPLDWYPGFKTVSTNPCGEIPLPPEDSCRLISLYIASCVLNEFTERASFDWDKFEEVVFVAQRLADDLIDLELECLEKILDKADTADEKDLIRRFITKCEQGRRTGLGTHGLGDTLARLGLRYDSDEAIAMVDKIYQVFRDTAYASSIKMAEERGPFPIWDALYDDQCAFIQRLPEAHRSRMKEHGRRNGALLTNAPTGSVSILSENCSSGIEPVFMLRYHRKRKLLDYKGDRDDVYIDHLGDVWESYVVNHKNLERYYKLHELPVDAPVPAYFVTAEEIDWETRVRVQGTIQQYIDHSISSTLNLPKTATGDDVKRIYMAAWKAGCKGVTVYRDGSREAQVLSSGTPDKQEENEEWARSQLHAAELQKQVDDLRTQLAKAKAAIPITPERGIETYGPMHKATFQNSEGEQRKVYTFIGDNAEGHPVEVFIQDSQSGPELMSYAEAVGRLISLHLKNGTPVEEIVEALEHIRGDSVSYTGGIFHSVPQLVARRLAKTKATKIDVSKIQFIGTKDMMVSSGALLQGDPATGIKLSGGFCSNCGENQVFKQGGCETCLNCGAGKCA